MANTCSSLHMLSRLSQPSLLSPSVIDIRSLPPRSILTALLTDFWTFFLTSYLKPQTARQYVTVERTMASVTANLFFQSRNLTTEDSFSTFWLTEAATWM